MKNKTIARVQNFFTGMIVMGIMGVLSYALITTNIVVFQVIGCVIGVASLGMLSFYLTGR